MSNDQSGADPKLTPQALELLKDIQTETEKLRELDLKLTPPAFLPDIHK